MNAFKSYFHPVVDIQRNGNPEKRESAGSVPVSSRRRTSASATEVAHALKDQIQGNPEKQPSVDNTGEPSRRQSGASITDVSQAGKSYFRPVPDQVHGNPEKQPSTDDTPDATLMHRTGISGSGFSQSIPSQTLSNLPSSAYPQGDFRNAPTAQIIEIKSDVMVNWLFAQQVENLWNQGIFGEGVVLKKTRNHYTCCPKELMGERHGFFDAIRRLNVRVRLSP